MHETELKIRRMLESDLPFVESLRERENWNQTPNDLARLLSYEPNGCFIASSNGTPVGTVTTTSYGGELGWIGMMLVHPEYRRRGIASKLIRVSMEYLSGLNIRCTKLDATPAGKPVYERLGFRAEWEFERWEREGQTPSRVKPTESIPFEPPPIDADVFGADRSAWLKRTARESQFVQSGHSFAMLRDGSRAAYLGPIVAEQPEQAREMIQTLIGSCNSRIIWDVPGPNADAVKLAQEFRFRPVRKLLRMWTGPQLVAGDVSRQYGLVDPATG